MFNEVKVTLFLGRYNFDQIPCRLGVIRIENSI